MVKKKDIEIRMKELIDKTKMETFGIFQEYHAQMSILEKEYFNERKGGGEI